MRHSRTFAAVAALSAVSLLTAFWALLVAFRAEKLARVCDTGAMTWVEPDEIRPAPIAGAPLVVEKRAPVLCGNTWWDLKPGVPCPKEWR